MVKKKKLSWAFLLGFAVFILFVAVMRASAAPRKVKEIRRKQAELMDRAMELRRNISTMKAELKEIRSAFKEKLGKQKKELTEKISKTEKGLSEKINETESALLEKITKLKARMKAAEAEISEIKSTLSKHSKTLDKLAKENADLRDEIKAVKKRVSANEDKISSLEFDISDIRGKLRDIRSDIQEVRSKIVKSVSLSVKTYTHEARCPEDNICSYVVSCKEGEVRLSGGCAFSPVGAERFPHIFKKSRITVTRPVGNGWRCEYSAESDITTRSYVLCGEHVIERGIAGQIAQFLGI